MSDFHWTSFLWGIPVGIVIGVLISILEMYTSMR